jgi:hypothetical protein
MKGIDSDMAYITRIRPKPKWHLIDFDELWKYRELFYIFAWRDIKVRYKQTIIGVGWVLFQPIFSTFIFTVFFGNLAKIPSGNLPYSLFVLIGLVFWNFFSGILSSASNSLIENENIIRKVYFPRLILFITQPLFYNSLISLTNLPYAVYLFLGAIYIYLWDSKLTLRDKKSKVGYLILSALFTGLSTWTRSVEPFWAGLLLAVFLVSLYRKKIWNILVFFLLLFPIRQIWLVFQSSLPSKESTSLLETIRPKILSALIDPKKWIEIIVYFYQNIIVPWGTIFAAFIIVALLVILIKKQRGHFLIFLITFIFLGLFIGGIFAFNLFYGSSMGLGDSSGRLSILFYPLFIYCIGLVLGGIAD